MRRAGSRSSRWWYCSTDEPSYPAAALAGLPRDGLSALERERLEKATLDDLGEAKKVQVTKENTTIIDGASSSDDIAGRVLFMFQPGEEGHHGAKYMLDEGLLDVPVRSDGTPSPVDAAFALHITSALPSRC